MKTKNRFIIITIVFLAIIFIHNNVKATSISISPSKPKVGDKVTITVTVPNVHTVDVKAKVSGVASGTIQVVGGDMAGKAKNYSNSATYKCEKEGNISVSVTEDSTAVLDGQYVKVGASKSISVAKKQTTTSNNDNKESSDKTSEKASSDATLKNLGIKPNDFSGFKKSTTSYSVSVPNSTEKISIYATPTEAKATVDGTGSKTLKEGKNAFSVKVTAPDKKTSKTYSITITRKTKDEEEPSNDATLKNLGITPKEYDFTGFKWGTKNYTVEVPNDVEEIYVYGYATDDNAKVSGLGAKTLKEGKNDFAVTVTAEDKKTKKTYTITVTRKTEESSKDDKEEDKDKKEEEKKDDENDTENETSSQLVEGLTNIEINDYTLTPSFNSKVYEYEVNVSKGTEKLDISTDKTGKDIEVEIAGNESLKEGNNTITILVHNIKEDTTTTYQINAKVGNEEASLSKTDNNLKKYQDNMKKKILIIAGIIIVIILIIIISIRKSKRQENYFDDTEDEYNDKPFRATNLYGDNTEDNARRGKYKGRRFK